ncbi:MAG: putative quinol monooxygenase [Rhodospirillaceae bacterium]
MTANRKITALLVAKPGKAAELEALIQSMITACRAEPGNLRWDVWQDRDDPTRFVLDELYVDDAAVAAHRASPHFLAYAAKVGDIADRTPVVSKPYDVKP